jgi:hypothetical protein
MLKLVETLCNIVLANEDFVVKLSAFVWRSNKNKGY